MKRYQKTIIAVIVLVSVAVGFYFVGYKTAYDRIEESPGSSSIPQTFYATITEINGNNFTVEGLDINDINYRGAFTFSVIHSLSSSVSRENGTPSRSPSTNRSVLSVMFYFASFHV